MTNPNIINGLNNRYFHSGGVKPVYGSYYDHIDKITSNPKPWKLLEDVQKFTGSRGCFVSSLKLTYIFRAMLLLKARMQNKSPIIYAATINISEKRIKELNAVSKKYGDSIVYNYAIHLKKRLERRGVEAELIAVVELGQRKKLHAHLAILCMENDYKQVRDCLSKDTGCDNGTQLKTTYKRFFRPRSQLDIELDELDKEAGISNFPLGANGATNSRYSEHPIDAGWMDYLAKELGKRNAGKGRKYYCTRPLNQLAKSEYDAKRKEYLKLIK